MQNIVLYSTLYTASHYTLLYCLSAQCNTVVYRVKYSEDRALHWAALHCTALHCTALLCTALHWAPVHLFCSYLLSALIVVHRPSLCAHIYSTHITQCIVQYSAWYNTVYSTIQYTVQYSAQFCSAQYNTVHCTTMQGSESDCNTVKCRMLCWCGYGSLPFLPPPLRPGLSHETLAPEGAQESNKLAQETNKSAQETNKSAQESKKSEMLQKLHRLWPWGKGQTVVENLYQVSKFKPSISCCYSSFFFWIPFFVARRGKKPMPKPSALAKQKFYLGSHFLVILYCTLCMYYLHIFNRPGVAGASLY